MSSDEINNNIRLINNSVEHNGKEPKYVKAEEKIKQNYDECDEYFYRVYRDNFSKITIVGIKGE